MKAKLKNIASIHTGTHAQTEINGDIIYLHVKHFNEHGKLRSKLIPDVIKESISERHLLQNGDILFAAKGTKNFATWYETKNSPAIASTSFFIIRITENFREKLIPEYLVWFINQPVTQNYLKGNAIGTSIASISKSVLSDLEILIPDINTQRSVINISRLRNTEKDLIHQLENLKESQIQQQLLNAIKQ